MTEPLSPTLVSIVLPVYNQADHLEMIANEYLSALGRIKSDYELIFVVNGSKDKSLEIAHQLAKAHPTIRVVAPDRSGWGVAVKAGLEVARGHLICYTNSARTHPNDLVLFLMYATAYQETVVKANRKVRESFVRRAGSLIYNILCRALFDLSYWDINGTPKVFPRKFQKLLDLKRDDDLIDLEFNLACKQMNYPVVEVPSFSSKRHGGKSTTNFKSAFRMYWGVFRFKKQVDGKIF